MRSKIQFWNEGSNAALGCGDLEGAAQSAAGIALHRRSGVTRGREFWNEGSNAALGCNDLEGAANIVHNALVSHGLLLSPQASGKGTGCPVS